MPTTIKLKVIRPGSILSAKKIKPSKHLSALKFTLKPKQELFKSSISPTNTGKIEIQAKRGGATESYWLQSSETPVKKENEGNFTCENWNWNGELETMHPVILNSQINHIYPGAVFPYKSIADGTFKPVPHTRKPYEITTTNLSFKKHLEKISRDSLGDVMNAINSMKKGFKPQGGRQWVKSTQILSQEDLFFRTTGSGYYLTFGGSHRIDFSSKETTHKYLFESYQEYYTIQVNNTVILPEDFFVIKQETPDDPRAINENLIDPNWVYVNSVSYGRLLHVLFESSESSESFGVDVNVYGSVIFAGAEADFNERENTYLKTVNIKVSSIGGDLIHAGLIGNAETLTEVRKHINNYFKKVGGEAVIGYSLRTLDQENVSHKLITQFTSRNCSPRAGKYRIIWEQIFCRVNDDGDSTEDIKAFARIRAFRGNGKEILDERGFNKSILAAVKRKIPNNLLPWTFTEGTESNPIELKKGGFEVVNRSIEFKIPKDDKNARLGIRFDVLEIDDFSENDDFASDLRDDIKISDLSGPTPIVLECRHEDSRVQGFFRIEPVFE